MKERGRHLYPASERAGGPHGRQRMSERAKNVACVLILAVAILATSHLYAWGHGYETAGGDIELLRELMAQRDAIIERQRVQMAGHLGISERALLACLMTDSWLHEEMRAHGLRQEWTRTFTVDGGS